MAGSLCGGLVGAALVACQPNVRAAGSGSMATETSTSGETTGTTGPAGLATSSSSSSGSTTDEGTSSSTGRPSGATTDGTSSTSEGSSTSEVSSSDASTTTDASTTDASSSEGSTTTGPLPHPLRVFVTSSTHDGDLLGPAGADMICNDLASLAGLGGTFSAWLSTDGEDAASRIDPSGEPYRLVDGTIIATDLADLLDGSLAAPIVLDETGAVTFGDVWTGTLANGTSAGVHCAEWTVGVGPTTGRCGSAASTTSTWTDNITPGCGTALRLYCFEQG